MKLILFIAICLLACFADNLNQVPSKNLQKGSKIEVIKTAVENGLTSVVFVDRLGDTVGYDYLTPEEYESILSTKP